MKRGVIILLAASAWTRAAAQTPSGSADAMAKHARWDQLLIPPAPVTGAARHWQQPVWPWQEMIGGSDPESALLATLAAGAPEAPASIDPGTAVKVAWRSARSDGVLVRPDLSLTPTEMSLYPEALANHEPMVAWACSDQAGQRTVYVFCYDRMNHPVEADFTPKEFGLSGPVMVLNRVSGEAWREPADETFETHLDVGGYGYFEIAPIRANGLVFFGDQAKYVSAGRARIAHLSDIENGVALTVVFAPGERDVTVFGFASSPPKASAQIGRVGEVAFNTGNGRYSVRVSPPEDGRGGVRSAEVSIVGGAPPPPRSARP